MPGHCLGCVETGKGLLRICKLDSPNFFPVCFYLYIPTQCMFINVLYDMDVKLLLLLTLHLLHTSLCSYDGLWLRSASFFRCPGVFSTCRVLSMVKCQHLRSIGQKSFCINYNFWCNYF